MIEALLNHLHTIERIRECWIKMPGYFSQELAEQQKRIKDQLPQAACNILRHAADYLYVEHGIAKSKQNPNCIGFYDRAAELLGLAMQELQFAIVRIRNAQEHN